VNQTGARWYESSGKLIDPELPAIHGLPWEFFGQSQQQ